MGGGAGGGGFPGTYGSINNSLGLSGGNSGGTVITKGSYNSLPSNAQSSYNNYSKNGWNGNFSGQTSGTAAGSKYDTNRKLRPVDAESIITKAIRMVMP